MDAHRTVMTRSLYLWIASGLVMTLNGVAAALQDRDLIVTALALTGALAAAGIAFGIWSGLTIARQQR